MCGQHVALKSVCLAGPLKIFSNQYSRCCVGLVPCTDQNSLDNFVADVNFIPL